MLGELISQAGYDDHTPGVDGEGAPARRIHVNMDNMNVIHHSHSMMTS